MGEAARFRKGLLEERLRESPGEARASIQQTGSCQFSGSCMAMGADFPRLSGRLVL